MDREEVVDEIECFLEEAETMGVVEFEVDNNYDSITVISIEGD